MGNTDSIPVVSQVKSGVQLVCGDTEGAARTQERFLHECPVVSQGTSLVYLVAGEGGKALDTQKRCGKGLLNAADGIPVIGHAKGVIHYAVGDKEGGHKAMKSATRTTGVLAGGAGGFLLGGPVGAVVGGIAAGAETDMVTTLVTGESSGYVAAIENAVKNPNPGDIFDLCLMPVADGLAGHSAGSVVRRLTAPKPGAPPAGQNVMQSQADLVKAGEMRAQAHTVLEAAEANKGLVPEIQTLTEMNKAQKLWNAANALEGKVEAASPKVATATPVVKAVDLKASATAPCTSKSAQNEEEERKRRKLQTQQQRTQSQAQRQAPRQISEATHRSQQEYDSESSSDSEEECTCEDISVPVLYVNMRSVNPTNPTAKFNEKIRALQEIIERNQPAIIAIVETWLKDGHENVQVAERLRLFGYTIWRQDRGAGHPEGNAYGADQTGMEGRRGGGILLAWRPVPLQNRSLLRLQRNTSEDFGDNIMSADILAQFNCQNCNERLEKKFGFTIVYRRPANDDLNDQIIHRLTHIPAAYNDVLNNYDGWSFVGDFNFHNGSNDGNFQVLSMFMNEGMSVFPGPGTSTHINGGCLDLVIASEDHFGGGVLSQRPISDHHAIIYTLNLGKDYPQGEQCEECAE